MTQSWTGLVFLHWPYEPAVVAPHLPVGTVPDVIDGRTWIGLIAFAMRDVRVFGLPAIPYLSDFLEMNVRAYAVDGCGRHGVVFLSLDADRLLPVAAARAGYRLPYIWSSMQVSRDGDRIAYAARRRLSGVTSRIEVAVGKSARPEPVDDFVTARWGLQSRWYRGSAYVPIAHPQWPLRSAEVIDVDTGLVAAAGLPLPVGPPRALYSDGVTVRLGAPSRLSPADPTG